MKRKFVMTFALLLLLVLPVYSVQPPLIVDEADLLAENEEIYLQELALDFQSEWAMDAVVLTVNGLSGKSARNYADDYYDFHGYGIDQEHSGLLLLVSMTERELYITTCGDAIHRLSDDELDTIVDSVAYYLSSEDYCKAFETYFSMTSLYIESYDAYTQSIPEDHSVNWLLSGMLGLVTAGIVLLIMRSAMNNKRPNHSASDYLKPGSYDLYRRHDIFLYSRVSKVRRQQNNSSGGTSVHRSSSGRSHGGRGGRF